MRISKFRKSSRSRNVRRRVTRKYKKIYVRSKPSSLVHSFKRMMRDGLTTAGNVAYAPLVATFSSGYINLAQVVNSTDFANLYDQYRINFVVLKFWLRIDPSAQTAGTASFPKLYWYRDYDDATAPAGLNEMRENAKCKVAVLHPNRPITIKFKPNTLQLIYQSAVANQFKPVFGQWIDMTTTNTGHYGIKYCVDDLTNTNYRLDTEATFYFQCRQPR